MLFLAILIVIPLVVYCVERREAEIAAGLLDAAKRRTSDVLLEGDA